MKRKNFDRNENGQIRGVVYCYTNISEGEEKGWQYVGNTMNEKTRKYSWNNHGNKSYGGEKINAARNEHGLENFEYRVLEVHYDSNEKKLQEKLDEREAYFVEKFDSIEHGYNTSKGGTGNNGVNFSETHRANIGKASKGRTHAEETKQLIGEKMKGHNVSDETRQKISQGNKGKKRTAEQRRAQSERLKGIEPKAATEKAKQQREENGGGYWKGKKMPDEAKKNMKEAQQKRGIKVKVVYKDGTTKDFNTMLDCAKELGIHVASVSYYSQAENNKWTKNGYKIERI